MKPLLKTVIKRRYEPLNVVEISRSRLTDNYKYLSSLNPKISIAPVLKSNAYGHGIVEISSIFDKLSPVFFCVDSIFEAYQLLNAKIKTPILITGYVDPENLLIKKLPFSYAVFDLRQLHGILRAQPQAKIHIFVDTGMHREGIRIDELEKFLRKLTDKEKASIDGLMSHLANAENPNNADTKQQIRQFKLAIRLFKHYSISPNFVHLGNSSGQMNNKKLELSRISNVVRTGLAIYGISSILNNGLKQVLELKTHIVQIKKIKHGEKVGYDFTYRSNRDGTIAILPIGYNDGVDRRLSNKGAVLVKNIRCPIIGRVSMNVTTIDISSHKNIKIGDVATVISSDGADNNIINIAKLIGDIPYRVMTHLERTTKRKII